MFKNTIRQLFARLNHHLLHHLIHRDPLPNAQTVTSTSIPPSLSKHCLKVALTDEGALQKMLGAHPEGLSAIEIESVREIHDENQLPTQKPSPQWVHLWICYRDPFNILLTILGAISYTTESLFAAGVIALMVVISTLLNFVQEARFTKAADALRAMVGNTVTVLRAINEKGENGQVELPIDQLIPGDVIKLAARDVIPVDLCVVQARDLLVTQASLTGESPPVEKMAAGRDPQQSNPLECGILCSMGTNVVSGVTQAIVISTDTNT